MTPEGAAGRQGCADRSPGACSDAEGRVLSARSARRITLVLPPMLDILAVPDVLAVPAHPVAEASDAVCRAWKEV